MKATALIQQLAVFLAEMGDVEVKLGLPGKVFSTGSISHVSKGNALGCEDVIVLSSEYREEQTPQSKP